MTESCLPDIFTTSINNNEKQMIKVHHCSFILRKRIVEGLHVKVDQAGSCPWGQETCLVNLPLRNTMND
jgi:hypothetical protein